ncbi:dihydrodipicolinate synthase family protein [Micromonospora sp. KC721]|uniref:dihydrodipicolinate synthase family protein n=1 Tax=Micromonospora sp. KC721 TaxID=2530380 RepID=UPI001045EAEA|nr:dihydrodipicolinate synthase family protein [Micromonospora sp. KC721]TDB82243.1 dihydrodipicolinate synthase family protein [Micromonospora sp. KC721]
MARELPVHATHALLVTPFTDEHALDRRSMRSLVDFVLTTGAQGVVALGTTGEFFTMRPDERVEVMETVIDAVAGRVPVTVGVGADSTASAVALARQAREAGADCVMVPPPFYFARSAAAQRLHFTTVASAVDLPVMIYDGADGIEVETATIASVAEAAPNVRYVKLALPKPDKVAEVVARVPHLVAFAGDDVTLVEALRAGAVGSAIATANIQSADLSKLHAAHASGDLAGATALFAGRLAATVLATGNPKSEFIARFKEVLTALGVIQSATVRPPLSPISARAREDLLATMEAVNVH